MRDTQDLIDSLAGSANPVRPLQSPGALLLRLGVIALIYAVIIRLMLGVRPDIVLQLQRPFFLAEIILLLALIATSLRAGVLLAFPDQYQHPHAIYWPLCAAASFVLLLLVQVFLPVDAHMVIPTGVVHGMECSLCIASVAAVPSAFMFFFLRKGASVYPFLSGSYAVLASAGIGCLMLRLSEANDSLLHLAVWHYIPTLLFAMLGAVIGRSFFKW